MEPHLLEEALIDDLLRFGISSFSLSIFDTDIISVSSFKYLGVMLSSTFKWCDHVEYISSKINKNLGLLRRIKNYLPNNARLVFL